MPLRLRKGVNNFHQTTSQKYASIMDVLAMSMNKIDRIGFSIW